jgi:hypothetical protein
MSDGTGTTKQEGCPDRHALVVEIRKLIVNLMEIDSETFEAIERGDFKEAESKQLHLTVLRERQDSLMKRFYDHTSVHGC